MKIDTKYSIELSHAQYERDGHEEFVIILSDRSVDENASVLKVKTFINKNEEFIPIFFSEERFREEVKGSGFEGCGLAIKRNFFIEMLKGDELMILNPGSPSPVRLYKSDLMQ